MSRSDCIELIKSMDSLIEGIKYDIEYFSMNRYLHEEAVKETLILLKRNLAQLISIKRYLTLEYLENEI